MAVRLEQLAKACDPMVVTVAGKLKEVMPLLSLKAFAAIVVVGQLFIWEGMTKSPKVFS